MSTSEESIITLETSSSSEDIESALETTSDAVTEESSDESSDGDDDGDDDEGDDDPCNQLLFTGASLTVLESYIEIMKFSLRHRLTKQALIDLLKLLDAHLPSSSTMISVHLLRKKFIGIYEDITFKEHSCCGSCQSPLKEDGTCRHGCVGKTVEFLQINVEPQLKRRFEDPVFWRNIQKRLETTQDPTCLNDVYNGKEYRKQNEFFSSGNISLTLNTDGVQVFRSSTISMWPIWLVINELPPQVRFSKKNVLLAGLWFSDKKPVMTTYLGPLIDEINKLSSEGFTVKTPDSLTHTIKARIVMCSADLPARAVLLNMKQFNGECGCCYCEDKGVQRATSALHRNWPYMAPSTSRTHQSIISNARLARRKQPCKGIKGASVLFGHHTFDLSKGCVIDYMHNICLGVVKTIMHLWIDQSHHAAPFSIRRKLKQCDARLELIRVPHDFNRRPRGLSKLKQWKASEYRSWLVYYSLPVLEGILPNPYFTHYSLLVAAMHIMLGRSITFETLLKGEQYLNRFYETFSTLYGENACTMNVHMVKHITECVRNWGPMWAYSCFSFESQNGHLKRLYHGTRNMNSQLAFSYILAQMLPQDPPQRQLQLSDCSPLGIWCLTSLTVEMRQEIHRQLQIDSHTGTMITRIRVNGVVYHSQAYRRIKTRNSYTVAYTKDRMVKYGFITHFLGLRSCTVAVIMPLQAADHYCYSTCVTVLPSKIIPVVPSPPLTVVPVSNLIEKCVCIAVDGKIYLARQPNPYCYFD